MIQLAFVAYIIAVIALSLMPASSVPMGLQADKVSHLAAYALMGVLAYLSTRSKRQRVYLFAMCFMLGLILELLQMLAPGRYASVFDLLANALGLLLAYAACGLIAARLLRSGSAGRKFLDSILSRLA